MDLADLVLAGLKVAPRQAWAAIVLAAACAATPPVRGCGLEDPASLGLRRGALNLAYPQSLHVGTAVWQAQLGGQLPADPLAQRAELPPEVRTQLRLAHATLQVRRLALALSATPAPAGRPSLALVLVGPVLWSRIEPGALPADAQVHADGPATGDVVVVSDTAVIEALVSGRVTVDEALRLGMVRWYGDAADAEAARRWLAAALRGGTT